MKRRSIGPGVSFFAFQDIITAVVGIFILITLILVLELSQRVEAAAGPPPVDTSEMVSSIESLESETVRLQAAYQDRLNQQMAVVDINEINREALTESVTVELQALAEQLASTEARLERMQDQLQQAESRENSLLTESQNLETQRSEIAAIREKIAELVESSNRLKTKSGLIYRDATDDGRALCIVTLDDSRIEVKDATTKSVQYFSGSDRQQKLSAWLSTHGGRSRHFLVLVRPEGAEDFDAVQQLLREQNLVFGFDVVAADHEIGLSFEWETQP